MVRDDPYQRAYGIFVIYDINDTYGIRHSSGLDMAICVSKDASGPKKCRTLQLNNLLIGLIKMSKY